VIVTIHRIDGKVENYEGPDVCHIEIDGAIEWYPESSTEPEKEHESLKNLIENHFSTWDGKKIQLSGVKELYKSLIELSNNGKV
jgi:hypothetical protein